jgi:hypothetical protein
MILDFLIYLCFFTAFIIFPAEYMICLTLKEIKSWGEPGLITR